MKTKTNFIFLSLAVLMLASATLLNAQSKDYKDGTVWNVTMVKTKPGMGDEYLKSLKSTLRLMYDEAVKQGLVLSYKVMQGSSANREDWDTMILLEYKNMAAMEGHDAQWDAIRDKVLGGQDQEKTLMKNRLEYREIMGEKMMREVIFN